MITHLLDTQAWIWFFGQHPRASKLVDQLPPDAQLGIAAITVWEAAMLEVKGRVTFHYDLITKVREMESTQDCLLVPLLPEIAITSTRLEGMHSDPSDRIVVATALHTGATLVTSDGNILSWAASKGRLKILAI